MEEIDKRGYETPLVFRWVLSFGAVVFLLLWKCTLQSSFDLGAVVCLRIWVKIKNAALKFVRLRVLGPYVSINASHGAGRGIASNRVIPERGAESASCGQKN